MAKLIRRVGLPANSTSNSNHQLYAVSNPMEFRGDVPFFDWIAYQLKQSLLLHRDYSARVRIRIWSQPGH